MGAAIMAILQAAPKASVESYIGTRAAESDRFERALGLFLAQLAKSAELDLGPPLSATLGELCQAMGIAGISVLDAASGRPVATAVMESGQAGPALSLAPGWNEQARKRLDEKLAWCPVMAVDNQDPALPEIAAALSQHAVSSTLVAPVSLAGRENPYLLFALLERDPSDSALFVRVRLIASALSLASGRLVPTREPRTARLLTDAEFRELERQNLLAVLESCEWRVQGERGAARALGLRPSTLRDRMKSFGLSRPR